MSDNQLFATEIRRENINSVDAASLILALNTELSVRYPEEGANHFRLDAEEVAEGRGAFLIAYAGGKPVGCGATRRIDEDTCEIKRMYVVPDARGRRVGHAILEALEAESRSLGARHMVLETGERQPEALNLYGHAGFERIPAFGEYISSPLSVCMGKKLIELPHSPITGLRTMEFTAEQETLLQRFFDTNPDYFLAVHGEPAGPDEARDEILGAMPVGFSFTKKWVIGYLSADNFLIAMTTIVSDFLAPGVWHIGLFILATSHHGTGDAQAIYQELESWAVTNGANWIRLGVVQGHERAERFWKALDYIETRTREGLQMGKLVNTVRVMFKPLAGGTFEQYLSRVQRDRPE